MAMHNAIAGSAGIIPRCFLVYTALMSACERFLIIRELISTRNRFVNGEGLDTPNEYKIKNLSGFAGYSRWF